jgi:hypothetical protein
MAYNTWYAPIEHIVNIDKKRSGSTFAQFLAHIKKAYDLSTAVVVQAT